MKGNTAKLLHNYEILYKCIDIEDLQKLVAETINSEEFMWYLGRSDPINS